MSKPSQFSSAAELLEEIARLMTLAGENPFKIRAFEKGSGVIAGTPDWEARANAGTLTELPGVGRGIEEVLLDFLKTGTARAYEELKTKISPALLELTQIPGLGPKKAQTLIDELGIQSVAELEYACRENRLALLKGFGDKLQQKILESIEFFNATRGQARLDAALIVAEAWKKEFKKHFPKTRLEEAGELRRRMEVVSKLEFLIETAEKNSKIEKEIQEFEKKFLKANSKAVPFEVHFSDAEHFGGQWVRLSSSKEHWRRLEVRAGQAFPTEEALYQSVELPWIAPELRETGEELELAKKNKLPKLLPENGIRGVFHNHTNRSDGIASLEEMVQEASRLGFEYIGISDHSQSAFYAHGLKKEDLKAQRKEIDTVQRKYPNIRIFWGIESDILAEGDLDYPAATLAKFDFVVASIHSRFGMTKDEMTHRVLKAIRNKHTTFLGHMTGRLLLGRKPFELDIEKVIEEAAAHDVIIEINSNPARLDVDWRWGKKLRKEGTLVSVNPDAHSIEGLSDTRLGVWMARKALLPAEQVFNSRSAQEVEKWLKG